MVVPWPHQRLWLCILFQQLWKVHLPKYTRPQKYDDYWDILSSQNIFPSSASSSYVYIQPALCMHYTLSYISNIVFKPKSFLLKRQTRRIHKKVNNSRQLIHTLPAVDLEEEPWPSVTLWLPSTLCWPNVEDSENGFTSQSANILKLESRALMLG